MVEHCTFSITPKFYGVCVSLQIGLSSFVIDPDVASLLYHFSLTKVEG